MYTTQRSSRASAGVTQREISGQTFSGRTIVSGSSPGISMISQRRRRPLAQTIVIGRAGSQRCTV